MIQSTNSCYNFMNFIEYIGKGAARMYCRFDPSGCTFVSSGRGQQLQSKSNLSFPKEMPNLLSAPQSIFLSKNKDRVHQCNLVALQKISRSINSIFHHSLFSSLRVKLYFHNSKRIAVCLSNLLHVLPLFRQHSPLIKSAMRVFAYA